MEEHRPSLRMAMRGWICQDSDGFCGGEEMMEVRRMRASESACVRMGRGEEEVVAAVMMCWRESGDDRRGGGKEAKVRRGWVGSRVARMVRKRRLGDFCCVVGVEVVRDGKGGRGGRGGAVKGENDGCDGGCVGDDVRMARNEREKER